LCEHSLSSNVCHKLSVRDKAKEAWSLALAPFTVYAKDVSDYIFPKAQVKHCLYRAVIIVIPPQWRNMRAFVSCVSSTGGQNKVTLRKRSPFWETECRTGSKKFACFYETGIYVAVFIGFRCSYYPVSDAITSE
jgi:hypothetical protein